MDRTAEFQRIIANRRAEQQRLRHGSTTSSGLPRAPVKRSDFAIAANQMAADISAASGKLAKLTQLAQSKSLFEDPTAEINDLTFIIKQEINELNGRLNTLQSSLSSMSGSASRQKHSFSVVESLKTRLLDTTKAFQDVLHTRSNNIQELQSRRDQFSSLGQTAAGSFGGQSGCGCRERGPSFAGGTCASMGAPLSVFELTAEPSAAGDSDACIGAAWASPAAKPASLIHRRPGSSSSAAEGHVVIEMGQQQLEQQSAVGDMYHESRAQAADVVHKTITELGSMYQRLALMVEEQGTSLLRIDENATVALDNFREGHSQLSRYLERLRSNRTLMLKVFAIVIFFVILWGTFFA